MLVRARASRFPRLAFGHASHHNMMRCTFVCREHIIFWIPSATTRTARMRRRKQGRLTENRYKKARQDPTQHRRRVDGAIGKRNPKKGSGRDHARIEATNVDLFLFLVRHYDVLHREGQMAMSSFATFPSKNVLDQSRRLWEANVMSRTGGCHCCHLDRPSPGSAIWERGEAWGGRVGPVMAPLSLVVAASNADRRREHATPSFSAPPRTQPQTVQ